MKLFTILFFIFSTLVSVAFAQHTIYVSQSYTGKEKDGTINHPYSTLLEGQQAARKYLASSTNDVAVILRGGVYTLTKTFELNEQDACKGHQKLIYKAYPNEQVIVSGGKQIVGWKKVEGKPFYAALVPLKDGFAAYFRQIYVNGRRIQQAKSDFIDVFGMPYDDPKTRELWDGYIVKTTSLKKYSNIQQLRIFQEGEFKHVEQFVDRIIPVSDSESAIVMKQPSFYEWTKNYVYNNKNQIRVINAFEELNEPGEFYLNQQTHTVYYYPQPGEKMESVKVIAPCVETLVKLQGAEGNYLNNIQFDGIIFQYGNWLSPNTQEFGRSQADLYATYKAIEGQFNLQYTNGVTIRNCRFEHLSSAGIYLSDNNRNTLIEANVFKDLTAAAILVGKDISFNASVNSNIVISNNVVRAVGADFFQASGIYANSSKNLTVVHNDVADVAYFGINQRYSAKNGEDPSSEFVGNTQFLYNKVSDYSTGIKYGFGMGDEVAGLYFFGVRDSKVSYNYVTYGGKNEYTEGAFRQDQYGLNNLWSYNVAETKPARRSFSHLRNQSKNILFESNFSNEILEDNPGADGKYINHHYEKNAPKWSDSAQAIINNAGLETKYNYLLNGLSSGLNIATKAKVTTSATTSIAASAGNVNDADVKTAWTADATNKINWIRLEFDQLYAIDKVQLVPVFNKNEPDARRCFEIQVSNDPNFKRYTVLGGQNDIPFAYNTSFQTAKVPVAYNSWDLYGNNATAGYKYLRLVGKTLSLSELRVYGHVVKMAAASEAVSTPTVSDFQSVAAIPSTTAKTWSKQCEVRVPFNSDVNYWQSRVWPGDAKFTSLAEGIKIETPKGTALFKGAIYGDEVIKMKLLLNGEKRSEHVIAFRCPYSTKSFVEQEGYFFKFSLNQIKLFRANASRERVLLIGTENNQIGKLLPNVAGKPALYEAAQNVEIETSLQPNGMKIILRINGETVIDCVDTTDGYLKNPGFINFWVRPSGYFLLNN